MAGADAVAAAAAAAAAKALLLILVIVVVVQQSRDACEYSESNNNCPTLEREPTPYALSYIGCSSSPNPLLLPLSSGSIEFRAPHPPKRHLHSHERLEVEFLPLPLRSPFPDQ